jgi:hypothetical protein
MLDKFSHLSKYEVKADRRIEYVIDDIEGEPVLILAPATSENKPYYNKLLRKTAKNPLKTLKKMNAGMVRENRDQDRVLFANYVVKDWKKVVDGEGKEVKFNEENCFEYLTALPDWIFDQVRNYAATPDNFIDDEDVDELSKNLQTD